MAELQDGRKYRLPTGQLVVARETGEGFLLEFRRRYASPILVDSHGLLIHNGDAMRLTVDCLTPVYTENEDASNLEMSAIVQMMLDIHERGGRDWEELATEVKRIHGRALEGSRHESA
ncbi:MAG: hypothetical protein GX443_09730 [Deltaproteobacteria bacterium]|nr:hypothetical protein [Deltaproteobacteria bacterium]